MNIVIKSSPWVNRDLVNVFGDEQVIMVDDMDISQLAVHLGAYPSTSKARAAGRKGPIPIGYNELKLNKKLKVYIWNPSE